jgi:hypothetical protein
MNTTGRPNDGAMTMVAAMAEVLWRVECGYREVTITRFDGFDLHWKVTNAPEPKVDQESIS